MTFASAERAEPPTFQEQVWACNVCGWAVDLCTEHREMAREIRAEHRALAEEIRAEQDEDARRDES